MIRPLAIPDSIRLARIAEKAPPLMNHDNTIIDIDEAWHAGRIGEYGAACYLGGAVDPKKEATWNFDLTLRWGTTVEVKTVQCSVDPEPDWVLNYKLTSGHQKFDAVAFCGLLYSFKRAWIYGWLPWDEWIRVRKFRREGEPSGRAGFTFKADCWTVTVQELRDILTLLTRPQSASAR